MTISFKNHYPKCWALTWLISRCFPKKIAYMYICGMCMWFVEKECVCFCVCLRLCKCMCMSMRQRQCVCVCVCVSQKFITSVPSVIKSIFEKNV